MRPGQPHARPEGDSAVDRRGPGSNSRTAESNRCGSGTRGSITAGTLRSRLADTPPIRYACGES
jgi:hypothetical protein